MRLNRPSRSHPTRGIAKRRRSRSAIDPVPVRKAKQWLHRRSDLSVIELQKIDFTALFPPGAERHCPLRYPPVRLVK